MVNTAKGTVNEFVGKAAGHRKLETKGTLQRIEGKAQDGLGDVEGAVHKAGHA